MRQLILASTSTYRAGLLRQLNLHFEAHGPGVDEEAVKAEGLSVRELAEKLACLKAEALASEFPDALLLGGDQIAEIDGQILSKPGTVERAEAQLHLLSGKTHNLWTAIAIHDARTGKTHSLVHQHKMTVRPLSDGQIKTYVAHDMPLDCCGSYKIESLGISLFERIEGNDHTAIVGVPLMELVTLLGELGVRVPGEVESL